jgi:hypothetical protein
MADYYELITRAMAGSGKGTDQHWRTALYARARGALVIELCRITPPLSEAEITRECLLFEEAIRKFETKSSHRSLSEAPVPAPPLAAPEHRPQEPEQGGPPMIGREPSPEACMPNLGNLEQLIGPSDPWMVPCPIRPSTDEVESKMGVSIGEGINSYTLDKPVADFRHGALWEFVDFEYEACRKDFGIDRRFRGEVFYSAADNVFLGRASRPAIVAALEGRVHKIYFGFMHVTEEDCQEFLRKASDHFSAKYGPPSGTRAINREQKTVFWDKSFGNLTLEMDSFWCRNTIIYSSRRVRPKERTWFGRILRNS